jgi:hypothetical protein
MPAAGGGDIIASVVTFEIWDTSMVVLCFQGYVFLRMTRGKANGVNVGEEEAMV